MGMITRDAALALKEPALSTLWVMEFPFATGVAHLTAERVTATWPKVPSRPRATAGSNTYFPETSDIDGISAALYETEDYAVTRWYQQWQFLVHDANGNYGVPSAYKKDCIARLYKRSNLTSPVLTLRYQGVWPTDKNAFELTYDDEAGRLTVELQFSTDSVTVEYGA